MITTWPKDGVICKVYGNVGRVLTQLQYLQMECLWWILGNNSDHEVKIKMLISSILFS